MEIVIDKMRPEELDQVLELHRTLIPYGIDRQRAQACLERVGDDPDYLILVAREGEQVLGTVTLILCRALAENFMVLEDFVVRPGLTGAGIGGRLMDAADDFAARKDCAYAILVSSGFRTDAHRFYENHGFTDEVRGFRKVYAP